ncbi:FAD-dependent oxidoreductase [Paludibaculum fermentans]|uniref:FAD-dependent oxidoreductase n=1 Tax=Paludibaculum fermentans TaxID=1473598 RepID=A0A7S7NWW7_PALFE|nr:FAD-dependent oxidoreductase [Paludibaculum fermentans]QOY91306.1 FAD-dependent oxidoreductase [Paludibaculum fermentans]
MNNGFYQIRVPDPTDYWVEMVKCRHACPVHTDACGYVNAIAEGRYEDGYRIARATNPFASICGRVCGAPCEANCRRGDLDEPVSIRALKRFVTTQFGPETGDYAMHRDACNKAMLPPNRGDYERIAVVGAGVSGLTVAHDLAQIGYKVTVFEADSEPGGMLTVGVPIFRLPRDLVRHEIQAILSLGVDLKCNMRLGRDFTIQSLRDDGFRAIFLGIGLPKGRRLQLPGGETEGVYDGMDFLRAFNAGTPLPLGKRIVVIGGGNVAYDVARSAVRPFEAMQKGEALAEMERGEQVAYDVARSALRMSGDKEVHVVCLESRAEMPADEIEVEEGAEEGIRLHNSRGPREVLSENGRVTGLRVVTCTSVFNTEGRFSPTFDEAQVEDIHADTVLFAIGQTSDLSFLAPEDGVESDRGLIKVNRETYQTTAPDVFACGDIAHGPRLFIDAIASAQIAARSMHDFLRGTRTDIALRKNWKPANYAMAEGWQRFERANPPALESSRRASSMEIVEEVYPEQEARHQAARCLRCNVNTIFDTSICVACNGCVDVCPENLIRLVGLSQLISDPNYLEMAADALLVPADQVKDLPAEELDALGGVMMKDETTCIRCAMCASRCPTHAITMKHFEFYRECVSVPTQNTKILYSR